MFKKDNSPDIRRIPASLNRRASSYSGSRALPEPSTGTHRHIGSYVLLTTQHTKHKSVRSHKRANDKTMDTQRANVIAGEKESVCADK